MKSIRTIKIVGGTLVALSSLSSYAQTSDVAAASPVTSAVSVRTSRAADRALQMNVRHALAKTKGLAVIDIRVRARGGAVVLEGSVPEQPEIDLATQVAQGVAGVVSVKNALTIRIPQ